MWRPRPRTPMGYIAGDGEDGNGGDGDAGNGDAAATGDRRAHFLARTIVAGQ